MTFTPTIRVTVVKTLILPKSIYCICLSPFNKAIFIFLWRLKGEEVKHQIITKDYVKIDLIMKDIVDFVSSLKSYI